MMPEQNVSFVDPEIDPLLSEFTDQIELFLADGSHPLRSHMQAFIRDVFSRAYQAEVSSYYPHLMGFTRQSQLNAVVGYREGANSRFFSEQYLDQPAQELAVQQLGRAVERREMVEVGNLAIADAGQARWLIAASTTFLAAAGYRWVLFTATRSLANAFRHLGLKPLHLGEADPARLPDGGASWGRYYDTRPAVYLGDIHAGCNKLRQLRASNNTFLNRLLLAAHAQGCSVSGQYAVATA